MPCGLDFICPHPGGPGCHFWSFSAQHLLSLLLHPTPKWSIFKTKKNLLVLFWCVFYLFIFLPLDFLKFMYGVCFKSKHVFRAILCSHQNWGEGTEMSHIPLASTYAQIPLLHYQQPPPELYICYNWWTWHVTITQSLLVYFMVHSWCSMSMGLDKYLIGILCWSSYLLCQILTAVQSVKSASSYCIILLKEQLKEHTSELVGK